MKEETKKTVDIKRILTTILGFPLVAVLLVFGNIYLIDTVLTIVALLAMYEYLKAISQKSEPARWVAYLSCISILLVHLIPSQYIGIASFLTLPTLLVILFTQVIVTNMKTSFHDIAYTFIGICYIVFGIISMSLIRGMENGVVLIWYLFFTGWGTDTFAYMMGKKFGKHTFSEVSPKKSIEGCIGGTTGAIILVTVFTYFINTNTMLSYNYWYVGILSIVLSIVGQLGDLAASTIKRYVSVKDYSNLIPGHGGMLDRIDSLLFIAPFAYILLGLM